MPVHPLPNQNKTRRGLLRSVGVLSACATAGRLSRLEGPETQIAEVVLVNLNDKTHSRTTHRAVRRRSPPNDGDGAGRRSSTSPDIRRRCSNRAGRIHRRRIVEWKHRRNQSNVSELKSGRLLSVTVQIGSDGAFREMPVDARSDRC